MTTEQRTAIKRFLLFSTISLFSLAAFLGVIFVLIGVDETAWKVCSTVLVFALLSLFSMNNIFRIESKRKTVKNLSIIALISNIFWSIPWIIFIWEPFKVFICTQTVSYYGYNNLSLQCPVGYQNFMEALNTLSSTAIIISMVTTINSNFMNIKDYSPAIRYLRIAAISSATFLGVYFLPAVWKLDSEYISSTWRLITIVSIVFVFSAIITPILAKVARNKTQATAPVSPSDEARLRQEIEAEVRAKIAQEIASTGTANHSGEEEITSISRDAE